MKKYLILLIAVLCILFILLNNEKVVLKPVTKCGFNLDNNSIIVEGNNKCFKHQRTSKPKEEIKRLMIVAHPDDETIFGGGHLLLDKYTVVCITCGTVDYRVKEFTEVMKKTNDDYIMLGFTDRVNKTGPISSWKNEYNQISNAIKDIIDSEDWDIIITHNPDGEYGHNHHRKTSQIVTSLVDKNRLYYFGHWYKNGSSEKRIDDNLYNVKVNELISIYYGSQKVALNYNYNMLPYENWIKATEW